MRPVEPAIAFSVTRHEAPALEVLVNFGIFVGRAATPAEIDELAHALRDELDGFTIVAEERHEFAGEMEASLHQVRIEATSDADVDRIADIAEAWAQECFSQRHSPLGEL
jgi:hypothetical protein